MFLAATRSRSSAGRKSGQGRPSRPRNSKPTIFGDRPRFFPKAVLSFEFSVLGRLETENIAIARSARRGGLGTRLLGEFVDLARAEGAESVFLEVRESNRAARLLYEKWSFTERGRRKKYYQDPEEDAILYHLGFA